MANKEIKYRPLNNPYLIVRQFEEELCNYTGAKYAVCVDSCTNALFLCCKYLKVDSVTIPRRTYLSVPQAIINAGGKVILEDIKWNGQYQLKPYPIFDSALRFTSNMFVPGTYMCLSFHYKKHLPLGKGGAILTDDYDAYCWYKKIRYEGRSEISYWNDTINEVGYNMYMTPYEAAIGLSLMQNLKMFNKDISEEDDYRKLDDFLSFLQ
jgi:UDP-4-amino-4,6-dideoxy-L-N-acetyl-beta-L-altrosamine transaminase